MIRFTIGLLAWCVMATCLAEENHYVCEALTVLDLNDTGTLEHSNFAKALEMHQSKFAVDRQTGVVAGGPFATVDAKDGRILSHGTEQEAFKVVWLTDGAYNHLKYLWVRTYAEGPKKPFLGVSGDMVVTGTCE